MRIHSTESVIHKKNESNPDTSIKAVSLKGLHPNPPDPFVGVQIGTDSYGKTVHYIPLIKNVISEREMAWRDEEYTSEWNADPTGSYLRDGNSRVVPDNWRRQFNSIFILGKKTGTIYMYNSDATILWFYAKDFERPQLIEWEYATASTIMTNKRMILFKNNETGIRMLLRLLDDRIANPSQIAIPCAFPLSSGVIIGDKASWWQNWSVSSGNRGYQIERSPVYLMYRHNVINDDSEPPTICTPNPGPYMHDYVPFSWLNYDPFNPNTFL